jgi:glutamate racemase
VVAALRRILPAEDIVYLGDTARVPYGSKSGATVVRYARGCAASLLAERIKLLLIACNTASAFALETLQAELPVTVLGAVEPGARAAAAATRSGVVGVIGTLGTVQSGAYGRALARLAPQVRVVSRACPLLVPLAEEGWTENEVAVAVARRYLTPLLADAPDLDVLLLGCTHYPLLRETLAEVVNDLAGHPVAVVDSAHTMATAAREELSRRGLLRPVPSDGRRGALDVRVTDDARIAEVGSRALGEPIAVVHRVDL